MIVQKNLIIDRAATSYTIDIRELEIGSLRDLS